MVSSLNDRKFFIRNPITIIVYIFYSDAKVTKKPELEIVLYIKIDLIVAIWAFCVKLAERL